MSESAPPEASLKERADALHQAQSALRREVGTVVVGQEDVVALLLIALLARGHGLFVGVPGLAKTLLINTFAQVLSLESKRIQVTPDLMPSDITGTDVLEVDPESGARHFRFSKGPIFTNLLLADEINRTPPKTQAALLQSMAEGQVTAGRRTFQLEAPYSVFATQNPIEHEGTYPLPEAQLDRFLLQVRVDYPSRDEEMEIVRRTTSADPPSPKAIVSKEDILAFQDLVPRVPVADHVTQFAVSLARATRPDRSSETGRAGETGRASETGCPDAVRHYVDFGAGPRASQALVIAAKARALLHGRYAAEIEDVQALATPVLRHRLVTNYRANAEHVTADHLVEAVLATIQP